MKRIWLAFALTICLALTLVATYLLPPSALAATGSASCGAREDAYCSAHTCVCIDGSGCTGFDSGGNVVSTARCSDQPVKKIAVAQPRPF